MLNKLFSVERVLVSICVCEPMCDPVGFLQLVKDTHAVAHVLSTYKNIQVRHSLKYPGEAQCVEVVQWCGSKSVGE